MSNLICGFKARDLLITIGALGASTAICSIGSTALGYTTLATATLVTAHALPAIAAIAFVYSNSLRNCIALSLSLAVPILATTFTVSAKVASLDFAKTAMVTTAGVSSLLCMGTFVINLMLENSQLIKG